jgi:hypothetical protein
MSEAELHLIRARLDGGCATRPSGGELELNLPVGLERDEEGRIVLTADEQVRDAIDRVFRLWRRLGSARQVAGELVAEGQRLPRRTVGQRRVRWVRASYGAVHDFLTNPDYAGAFVFGRTRQQKSLGPDGRVNVKTVELPLEQWSVCIPDHHPGYVCWQEYLATRERLRANGRPRGEGGGAPGEGPALLQGILRCGRCGRRMQVAYSGNDGRVHRYSCQRGRDLHATGAVCQSLGGLRLERAVAQAFLEAVTPAGIRASAEAIGELERQHEERLRAQRLAVERAGFEAGRARRQFDACEPEHRLVRRTPEARLEEALGALERERRKLAELERRRPEPLTAADRQALARIARDLPRLWDAETTTARDRKELLRTLVAEAIVTVRDEPRRAEIEIAWEGGARSRLLVPLIRRGPESKRTDEDTVELIARLAAHHPDRQIAAILNKQGRRTGTGLPFNEARVKGHQTARRHPRRTAARPRRKGRDDPAGRHRAVGVDRDDLPMAQDGPAARGTDHPARALADPPDRRAAPPVRARRARRLRAARRGRQRARRRPPNRPAQGPTRRTQAVQVTNGRRKGLRIQVSGESAGLFDQ